MTLSLNAIETLWIALNLTAVVLTLSALVDALADRSAVRLLNGHARELTADGIVRRESFRLVIQTLLLVAVLPGAMVPGEAVINLTIIALMAVPVTLVTSSILDARERRRSTIMVAADILAERTTAMARLEAAIADNKTAIAENTDLTVMAGEKADDARATASSVETTVGHTAEQVEEIYGATVKP